MGIVFSVILGVAVVLGAVALLIINIFDISISSIPGSGFSDFILYMNQNVGSLTAHQAATFITRLQQSVNGFVNSGHEGPLTFTQLMDTPHFNKLSTTRDIFTQLVKAKSARFPRLGEGSVAVTITQGAVNPSDAYNELIS